MNICRQVRLYYVGRRAITGFEGQRISIFGLRSASRDVATAQGNVGPAPGQARQGRLVLWQPSHPQKQLRVAVQPTRSSYAVRAAFEAHAVASPVGDPARQVAKNPFKFQLRWFSFEIEGKTLISDHGQVRFHFLLNFEPKDLICQESKGS